MIFEQFRVQRRLLPLIRRQFWVGVQEYWIVDWQQQTVEIYRRSQARLVLEFTLYAEDDLTSPLFDGFSLKVASPFE